MQHGRFRPGLLQSGNYGLGFVRLAVVSANYIDTACGQVFGSVTAKAAAGASDQAILRVMFKASGWVDVVSLLVGSRLLNPVKMEILFDRTG